MWLHGQTVCESFAMEVMPMLFKIAQKRVCAIQKPLRMQTFQETFTHIIPKQNTYENIIQNPRTVSLTLYIVRN
jgi:hypothetical protein